MLRSEELSLGVLRQVFLEDRGPVLLARLRTGEVAAAEPLCPHEQARLADGTISGDAVDCPKHHYMFDLRSGENLYPWRVYPEWKRKEVGDLSLTVYACREEDGWIVVELDP